MQSQINKCKLLSNLLSKAFHQPKNQIGHDQTITFPETQQQNFIHKTSMMQISECTDENIFLTTTAKNTLKCSPSGNRTTVSRVTGGDTYHYTNDDWEQI